jgi:hypothetical protein
MRLRPRNRNGRPRVNRTSCKHQKMLQRRSRPIEIYLDLTVIPRDFDTITIQISAALDELGLIRYDDEGIARVKAAALKALGL